jgi:hypothetical protein
MPRLRTWRDVSKEESSLLGTAMHCPGIELAESVGRFEPTMCDRGSTRFSWISRSDPARFVPTPPPSLVRRVARVVSDFEDVRFQALEDLVADPASPRIRDVVKELARARDLAK